MSKVISVRVSETRGSTPREVGAVMQVFPDRIAGTIGGGALEWEAIHLGRAMVASGSAEMTRTFALGPDMGQCCGGAITLHFTAHAPGEPPGTPILIWGAGHVGRAIAATLAPIQGFSVTLIDDAPARLPKTDGTRIQPAVAKDMPQSVALMPKGAHHLILTYSHDIDLALCDALLRHGFVSCGLIGSATKWARFRKRLRTLGHTDAEISRIACPIGDPSLGKHPQAIAIGVAARLLNEQTPQESVQEGT